MLKNTLTCGSKYQVLTDGSGKFGAHAQRHMVVEGMQSALSSNDGIRSESVYFN